MIESMLSYFAMKDLALLALGGLVSWWTSRFFYQKQVQRKELTYCTRHSSLLPKDLSKRADFSLTLSGRKLVNPSKVRIAVWNSGNHLVQRADFGGSSAISIALEENEILAIELVKISRPETLTTIAKTDDANIAISLDYWNPGDGIMFDAYVEATPDRSFLPDRDMKVIADIRGNESSVYDVYWKFKKSSPSFTAKSIYVLSIALTLAVIAIQSLNLYQSGIYNVMIIPNIISMAIFLMVLFVIVVIPVTDRQPAGRSFPSRLETKTDDEDGGPVDIIESMVEIHGTSS
jgi:hypothetical protein